MMLNYDRKFHSVFAAVKCKVGQFSRALSALEATWWSGMRRPVMKHCCVPRSRVALSTAGVLSLALVGLPTAPGRAADDQGWYTQAQAAQGHQLFNNRCAECHRPDLTGSMGPALVGDAFLSRWGNRPLGDLFEFEHSKMPAVAPGSVPDDQMWAITAYILQRNGFPAGATALSQQTGTSRMLSK